MGSLKKVFTVLLSILTVIILLFVFAVQGLDKATKIFLLVLVALPWLLLVADSIKKRRNPQAYKHKEQLMHQRAVESTKMRKAARYYLNYLEGLDPVTLSDEDFEQWVLAKRFFIEEKQRMARSQSTLRGGTTNAQLWNAANTANFNAQYSASWEEINAVIQQRELLKKKDQSQTID